MNFVFLSLDYGLCDIITIGPTLITSKEIILHCCFFSVLFRLNALTLTDVKKLLIVLKKDTFDDLKITQA